MTNVQMSILSQVKFFKKQMKAGDTQISPKSNFTIWNIRQDSGGKEGKSDEIYGLPSTNKL